MNEGKGFSLSRVSTCHNIDYCYLNDYGELNKIIKKFFLETGFAIAYLDYKVMVGTFHDGLSFYQEEKFKPKYLQRLRVFNEKAELLIWRDMPGSFRSRFRQDGEGEQKEVIDAYQVLWGTRKKSLAEGWVRIFEKRGTSLVLPFSSSDVSVNSKRRAKLKTRNYINYNHLGQAGYFDCRFVDIILPKND